MVHGVLVRMADIVNLAGVIHSGIFRTVAMDQRGI